MAGEGGDPWRAQPAAACLPTVLITVKAAVSNSSAVPWASFLGLRE